LNAALTHHMSQNTDVPHILGCLLQRNEPVRAYDRHDVVLFTRLKGVSRIFRAGQPMSRSRFVRVCMESLRLATEVKHDLSMCKRGVVSLLYVFDITIFFFVLAAA
jgi:hypothetical protein